MSKQGKSLPLLPSRLANAYCRLWNHTKISLTARGLSQRVLCAITAGRDFHPALKILLNIIYQQQIKCNTFFM